MRYTNIKSLLPCFLILTQCAFSQDNLPLIRQKTNESRQISSQQKHLLSLWKINELYYNSLHEKFELVKLICKKADSLHDNKIKALALLDYGWCENYNGQYVSAEKVLKEAAMLFLQQNDSLHYALTLSELSITKRRTFFYKEAETAATEAYSFLKRNKNISFLSTACYNLASVYMDMELFDKGLYYGQLALKYAEVQKNTKDIGFALMILARVHDHSGDNHKAESYFLKAEKILDTSPWCIPKGINYSYLIPFYSKKEDYRKALYYLDKITLNDICLGKSPQQSVYYKTWMEAVIFEKMGDYTSAIKAAEQNLSATDSSLKVVGRYEEYQLKGLPRVLIPYAKSLFKSGQTEKAKEKSLYAFELAQKFNRKSEITEVAELLSFIYQKNNAFEEAYTYEKIRSAYHDSIIQENKLKEINRLQAVFDTENLTKEKNILSKANEIKELQIKQNKLLYFVAIAILLALAITIYFILQKRKWTLERKKAEIEERFLRSQLNPHFIFNSLIAIQNYILQHDTNSAGKYLAKFSKLIRAILENSREEFIELEKEISSLENYLSLQQLRFNNNFSFSFNISPSIDTGAFSIPPMFIQPFLENSIEHGLNGLNKHGEIRIDVKYHDKKNICIEITDNGIGRKMAEETKNKMAGKHQSLATKITADRIQFIKQRKNREVKITISDINGDDQKLTGTKVEIVLPFKEI